MAIPPLVPEDEQRLGWLGSLFFVGESREGKEAREEEDDKNGAKFFDRFEDRKKRGGETKTKCIPGYLHVVCIIWDDNFLKLGLPDTIGKTDSSIMVFPSKTNGVSYEKFSGGWLMWERIASL